MKGKREESKGLSFPTSKLRSLGVSGKEEKFRHQTGSSSTPAQSRIQRIPRFPGHDKEEVGDWLPPKKEKMAKVHSAIFSTANQSSKGHNLGS